VKGLHPKHT